MNLPSFLTHTSSLTSVYKNERIIMIVHHHWWNLLKEVVGVALLFLAPVVIVPVIWSFMAASGNSAASGAVVGFLGSLWMLVCWSFLFSRWTDYYFDVWIITNWRIIDMDLRGLFRVDIASMLDLNHIQELSTHTDGILQNILGFGNILIQTAATKTSTLLMLEVPSPVNIERVIRSAQVELQRVKAEHAESI